MEPMNAPPAESPPNLRRQTTGHCRRRGGFEEVGLGLRFGLVMSSVSVSRSDFGESIDVIAMAVTLSVFYEVMAKQDLGECESGEELGFRKMNF
ncbi:unnamed protein product [Prunus armeniaca]|uniref:Uncharacterized protein n=1 Tax=Prunus armeniaca TaxID=36596 RepID=A0A6J5TVB9_PRUAR|nr:unnamed protein product [Prunus armeniaca]